MRAPSVKISIKDSGRDLTDMVDTFTYESCIDKDNLVHIKVKKDASLSAADDEDLVSGEEMNFQFGYIGEQFSAIHKAVIKDVEVDYSNEVSLDIHCLDKGNDMKRSSEVTVWKNKTSSQIIEEIANKYNLVFVGEPTTKVWESMPQSNRSDFEFAQYLSTIETGGQYIFYITDDELHFEKQDYGKKSKWLYTYGKDIIRFKPKLKESNNKGAANKVTLKTVDPSKKASVETSADFNTDTGAKLGGFSTFDVSGNKTGGDLIKRVGGSLDNQKGIKNIPPPSGGKSIPVPSKSDSFNMASSLNKKKSMILTATLEVEGNPLLMAGDIITVENVAKRHEGNWYVNKATHVIKGKSSYLTTLEMVKNGVSKPASSSPAKSNNVNNSIGPKDGNVKKVLPVVRYDANGNRLKN